ncbi:MAG TPA: DNA methyltransferase [Candidatus Competibacteraceae bacterium]|nr:DNA methyltransferase [Candidatus Competibacteraceae bacterium]HRZ07151.1 DNA methyltransferase [Candidatus Competibacteraceae bacterium]HSA46336.1 DNA methyltransferase [Candidatus Competibacteraceae bacterium]
MTTLDQNTLFYGDNLKILREYIPDESVDLIYLDPPFNSNRNYNILFKDEAGREMNSQIRAFEDTWHWVAATEEVLYSLISHRAGEMLSNLCQFMGKNQMTAYLVMMTVRLIELHRVLKLTGSLYLHCDPTASHYLKIVLDCIFGFENFRNEIIWQRTSARSDSKKWNHVHDVLFFYSKSEKFTWNNQYIDYGKDYINKFYCHIEPETGRRYASDNLTADGKRNGSSGDTWKGIDVKEKELHWKYTIEKLEELDRQGRIIFPKTPGGVPRYKRYLDEMPGVAIKSMITDIPPLSAKSAEKLGYPTQKPLALLKRIIKASSNEGDWVLDPFCGCGTATIAAEGLKRRWIGIDVTHLAIALQKYRLKDVFNLIDKKDYQVLGQPEDLPSARQLALDDRYQFQWWAGSLIKAMPFGGELGGKKGKKGSDQGIDGFINFIDEPNGKFKKIIVQIKSGKVKSGDIRDLIGVVQREQSAIGVFITLEPPTKEMKEEAVKAGFYFSPGWNQNYPKIQILTIEELLKGQSVQMPPTNLTFKTAPRNEKSSEQKDLNI